MEIDKAMLKNGNVRAIRPTSIEIDPVFITQLAELLARAKRGEIVGIAAAVETVGPMWEQRYLGTARRVSLREFCGWLDEMHFDMRMWIHIHDKIREQQE